MSAPLYGAWLRVEGQDCLVVGGGAVATRRVRGLLECGARVRVVAPAVTAELEELAGQGQINLLRREYQAGDVIGARLLFAATSSGQVNAAVAQDGQSQGSLTNLADNPTAADFHAAAVIHQGSIALALGTGGHSPTATAALRVWLTTLLTPAHARAVDLMGVARGRSGLGPSVEKAAALLARGDAEGAVREMDRALAVV